MKLLLKIVAAFAAFVLVAILALVVLFDLNLLKPRIEAIAKEQGADLQIRGDLGWTFWPSLGVTVEDIRVAAIDAGDQPIAQLKQASLLVALTPLLSGDIQVHHVQIDGADIYLQVDKQGKGNWEDLATKQPAATDEQPNKTPSPTAPPKTTDAPAEAADGQSLELAVERISLANSSLSYSDEQSGKKVAIEDIQFDVRQFNVKGQPFAMSLALKTTLSDQQAANKPLVIELSVANQMQLNTEKNTLNVTQGEVAVVINDQGKVSTHYHLNVEDLHNSARFSGELNVPIFDLKALLSALGSELNTNEKNALTAVGLNTRINGNKQQLTLEPFTLALDKTRIEGKVAIADFSKSALWVVLAGDEINVDDYLAPPAPEAEKTTAKPSVTPTASVEDTPMPLAAMRALDMDIRMDFDKLIVSAMPVEKIQLRLHAKNGLISLNQADANLYQGTIATKGSVDARGDAAIMQFTSQVKGVDVAPAMHDLQLDENIKMSGAINADVMANSRGATVNQFMEALIGEANMSGAQLRLSPLNVEQQFCEIMNLVKEVENNPEKVWDEFTDMQEVTGKITMAQRVIKVETFSAGVHQLVMGTQGKLNLATNEYNFTLPLKLLTKETSEKGCSVTNNYWLNRSLSLLRCKGSLAAVDPIKDCGLDSQGVKELTKEYLAYKLRKEVIGDEGEGDLATGLFNALMKKNRKSNNDDERKKE